MWSFDASLDDKRAWLMLISFLSNMLFIHTLVVEILRWSCRIQTLVFSILSLWSTRISHPNRIALFANEIIEGLFGRWSESSRLGMVLACSCWKSGVIWQNIGSWFSLQFHSSHHEVRRPRVKGSTNWVASDWTAYDWIWCWHDWCSEYDGVSLR